MQDVRNLQGEELRDALIPSLNIHMDIRECEEKLSSIFREFSNVKGNTLSKVKERKAGWKLILAIAAINFIIMYLITQDVALTIVIGFVTGLVAAVVVGNIVQAYYNNVKKKEIAFLKPEIEEKERELAQKGAQIKSEIKLKQEVLFEKLQSITMPANYISYEAMDSFYEYLDSGRATTFRECIEIFEMEKHRRKIEKQSEEMIERQKEMANQYEQQLSQLESNLNRTLSDISAHQHQQNEAIKKVGNSLGDVSLEQKHIRNKVGY